MVPLKEKHPEDSTSASNSNEDSKTQILEAPSLRPRRSVVNYNEKVLFSKRKRFSTENSDSEDSNSKKARGKLRKLSEDEDFEPEENNSSHSKSSKKVSENGSARKEKGKNKQTKNFTSVKLEIEDNDDVLTLSDSDEEGGERDSLDRSINATLKKSKSKNLPIIKVLPNNPISKDEGTTLIGTIRQITHNTKSPSCQEVLKATLLDEERDQFTLLELLVRVRVFQNSFKCKKCSRQMVLKRKAFDYDGYEWRCQNLGAIGCSSRSVRENSGYERSGLSLLQILKKCTDSWASHEIEKKSGGGGGDLVDPIKIHNENYGEAKAPPAKLKRVNLPRHTAAKANAIVNKAISLMNNGHNPTQVSVVPRTLNLDIDTSSRDSPSSSTTNNNDNYNIKEFGDAEEQHFGRIPSQHLFREVYRPSHLKPHPTILARTIRSVTTLGKALFHDSSWSKFDFPPRSTFGRESIVYFYRSMRWPKRTTVWIPYGKGVVNGDVPYTCGSCFKFNACLKHHFDRPRTKIPIIISRNGQFIDDPDFPRIPHVCEPSQLTEEEKEALREYGEYAEKLEGDVSSSVCESQPLLTAVQPMGHLENTLDKPEMVKLSSIKMKLNQCYYKWAKFGLAFTMDMLKSKTFELAEQESFSTSFFTEQWFDETAQLFCINGDVGHSTTLNSADVPPFEEEEDNVNFENANDYLLNVITATMAKQQDDEYGTSSSTYQDEEVPMEASRKGISIYVKESRPIEFVNKPIEELPCSSNSLIKQEVIELSESSSASSSHGGRDSTFDSVASPMPAAKEATPTTTRDLDRLNQTTKGRDSAENWEEPPARNESRKSVDSDESLNGLQNYIQNNYVKTNHPEIAHALDLIHSEIVSRDVTLLPMFNTFSSRLGNLMYTTKLSHAQRRSEKVSKSCVFQRTN